MCKNGRCAHDFSRSFVECNSTTATLGSRLPLPVQYLHYFFIFVHFDCFVLPARGSERARQCAFVAARDRSLKQKAQRKKKIEKTKKNTWQNEEYVRTQGSKNKSNLLLWR